MAGEYEAIVVGARCAGAGPFTKDPITAQGISDAFHDAEPCSAALAETLDGGRPFSDVMSAYQRARDARTLPIYEFTTQLATLEAPPPAVQQLLAAVHGDRAGMDSFASVIAGTLSPAEFFSTAHTARAA